MSIALSFRTEEQTRDRLDQVAKAQDRNRNWVINEAIQAYLEQQQWRLQQVKKGMADVKAGRTRSHQDVQNHFARLKARK